MLEKSFTSRLSLALAALAIIVIALSVQGNQAQPARAVSSAQAAPSPSNSLYVSYLKDGALWLTRDDGAENQMVVPAPESEPVANQLWSKDGSRIFYNAGTSVFAYLLNEKRAVSLGTLEVPEGAGIDRFEVANDGHTLLFHTLDPNDVLGSVPRIYAFSTEPAATRELSVDEYHLLAPVQSTVIRNPGDLSVSPDGKQILFAEAAGKDIQLFVADIETGSRHQVTNLADMDGFEAEATPDGSRRILEATWLPDGRHIVFVPAQSCSEFGLCSGKMFMVDAWGGAQLQLALQFTAGISQEWNPRRNMLVYDDGGQVLLSDMQGQVRQLSVGNQPRWQPAG